MSEVAGRLADEHYVSLVTYKRDGRGVTTPVWFVADDGRIYFRTPRDTGKVKRMRLNPRVSFSTTDRTGTRTGSTQRGTARLIPRDQADRWSKMLHDKYGVLSRLYALSFWLPGRREIFVELTPDESP